MSAGGLLKTESYRSGIALSVGFSLLAKLIALASSLVLAALFGTSAEMDVYLYVFFAAALVTTFISALNSSVIIPEAMRLAGQESEGASRSFINFFLYAYGSLGAAVSGLFLISPAAAFGAVSRFEPGLLAANSGLLYAALPLFPLMLVSGYLSDVLASRKYFTMPMIAAMLNNAFVLVFVLSFHRSWGVTSALCGLCAAHALQALALACFMKRKLDWDFSSPARPSRRVLGDALFAQLGNLATAVSSYVPMFLLSGFDRGTVSAMNYGRQAAEFPNNFITQQFSSVAGIKLNEVFAQRRLDEADRVMVSSLKGLFFALVPMSLFGAFYSGEIMSVLFGRGAFGPEAVESSSAFFRLFALLLPFYAANSLTSRLFMAAQKVRQAFWYQLCVNILLAALIMAFVMRFGALGYPAGLLVFYALNLFATGFLIIHYFPGIRYWQGILYALKVVALDLALLLPVWLAVGRYGPDTNLFRVVLAAAVYFGLLAGLSVRLGVNEEVRRAWAGLKGKIAEARER
ncbi:MAG: lipid II flippase MurJ [Elusimicrobiales bacterium]